MLCAINGNGLILFRKFHSDLWALSLTNFFFLLVVLFNARENAFLYFTCGANLQYWRRFFKQKGGWESSPSSLCVSYSCLGNFILGTGCYYIGMDAISVLERQCILFSPRTMSRPCENLSCLFDKFAVECTLILCREPFLLEVNIAVNIYGLRSSAHAKKDPAHSAATSSILFLKAHKKHFVSIL